MNRKLRAASDKYALARENLPENLGEAYRLAQEKIEWSPAAWKLGGSTKNSKKALGCDQPLFGPLAPWETETAPFTLEIPQGISVCGEGELLLRIGNLQDAMPFDAWAWGVELPSPSITNLSDFPFTALALDRCAAFFLIIGKQYSMEEAWSDAELKIRVNGKTETTGSLAELLLPPEVCGKEFIKDAASYGVQVMPGQWIATGGLTKCVPIANGKVEMYWGSDLVCQFEARQPERQ